MNKILETNSSKKVMSFLFLTISYEFWKKSQKFWKKYLILKFYLKFEKYL